MTRIWFGGCWPGLGSAGLGGVEAQKKCNTRPQRSNERQRRCRAKRARKEWDELGRNEGDALTTSVSCMPDSANILGRNGN